MNGSRVCLTGTLVRVTEAGGRGEAAKQGAALTDADWTSCREPEAMLAFLRESGTLSERKLRLFGVAVCRRIWPLLTDPRSHKAVELAEQWAEGRASEDGRDAAETAANDAYWQARSPGTYAENLSARATLAAAQAVCSVVEGSYADAADQAARASAHQAAAAVLFDRDDEPAAERASQSAHRTQEAGQAALLRDIFGSPPFGSHGPLDSSVLRWNDGTVVRIAQGIYDERRMSEATLDTGRLAVLADALLDAGCEDEALLQHLREPGPHYRGCHGVDLILGKD